jgi:hypothetical protein
VSQEKLWSRVRKSCGPGKIVSLDELWARKSCGPGGAVVMGQEELWARRSCGPRRAVGQEVLWARMSCGPGRGRGLEELWARKSCRPGRVVGQKELWARKCCGPERVVGQEEIDLLTLCSLAYFWLDGVPYIFVHDDNCCPKAIDLFLAHILALFLAYGPGDVLHFYLRVVIILITTINKFFLKGKGYSVCSSTSPSP